MNQNRWILVDKSVEIKATDPKIGQNRWILRKTLEIGGKSEGFCQSLRIRRNPPKIGGCGDYGIKKKKVLFKNEARGSYKGGSYKKSVISFTDQVNS